MRSAKFIRWLRGMSQFELSCATRIPNYRLSRLENGKDNPTSEELTKIAAALGTMPAALDRDPSAILLDGNKGVA
jgi:transcriptional regulator with XRE-family HTH domain